MDFGIAEIAAAVALLILFCWFRISLGPDMSALRCLGAFCLALGLFGVTFNCVRVSEHIMVADLFLMVGGILTAPALLFEGRLKLYQVRIFVFGALLLCFGLVSAQGSTDVSEDAIAATRFSLALVGVPILIAASANSTTRFKAFIFVWLAGSAFNALWGVLQFMDIPLWNSPIAGDIYSQSRVSGLTAHPNNLAIASLLSFPVAFVAMVRHPTIKGRSLYGLIALLLALGTFVTGSRAGLVGLAIGLGLVSYIELRHRRRTVIWLSAFGLLAITILPAVASRSDNSQLLLGLHRLVGGVSVGSSDDGRLELYDQAISDFILHPVFGIGLSNVKTAHNLYLQLLQSGGVASFLIFFSFVGYGSYHGLQLATDFRLENRWRGIAGALVVSIVVWLFFDLAQNALYDRFVFVPTGFIFALLQLKAPSDPRACSRLDHYLPCESCMS